MPGRRGSGWERAARLGLAAFALVLVGVPSAFAAEVVEVRVGRHPDFTRVVFELDRAAGYRIERSAPGAGETELIISLEAGSIPRRIQSSKSFIEQVVVEPSGARSVARIRLARGGLKLKEMILASPPRIVLDVISDQPAATTASSTAAKPATTVAATKPATKPATTAATTQATKPATTTAAAQTATKPATTPAASKPVTTLAQAPTSKSVATEKPVAPVVKPPASKSAPQTKLLATTEKSGASASKAADASSGSGKADGSKTATAELETAPVPSEWVDGDAAGGAGDGAAGSSMADAAGATPGAMPGEATEGTPGESPDAANATAHASKERPMMVKESSGDEDEGGGLMKWALAGLGLAVVAFGGLVVARRRRAAAGGFDADEAEAASPFADADTDTESDEAEAEEEDEEAAAASSSNPFAGLSSGDSFGASTGRAAVAPPRAADKQDRKPSESVLFDDAEEKTMEGMEVVSRSQAGESLGGGMPMMGGASDELTQMFREMQRRVAALEGRIDELVDARDRLERQVAAQTEELRVQRAAIARTQRAVRNLARPEDAGDDEPTEPALRDPN